MVDCYLQTNRLREAESMAMNACKQLNYSAQGYCVSMVDINLFYKVDWKSVNFSVACICFTQRSNGIK